MKQKDIKEGKLYSDGKTVHGVVEIHELHFSTKGFLVEYVTSVENFCDKEFKEQSLKSFARWAKMECEFELQIKEE